MFNTKIVDGRVFVEPNAGSHKDTGYDESIAALLLRPYSSVKKRYTS